MEGKVKGQIKYILISYIFKITMAMVMANVWLPSKFLKQLHSFTARKTLTLPS